MPFEKDVLVGGLMVDVSVDWVLILRARGKGLQTRCLYSSCGNSKSTFFSLR